MTGGHPYRNIINAGLLQAFVLLTLSACRAPAARDASPAVTTAPAQAATTATPSAATAPPVASSTRSLASFAASNSSPACYDRDKEPYTAVVDAHFHPRPFGGQAMAPSALFNDFDKAGVRFVNYFGIGQVLDMASSCTYYLDCPGTPALPSIKNDFVNGADVKATPHPNVNIVLSMTFIDLAHPEGAVEMIRLYDREFPGMFKWAGELNVEKQALLPNKSEPATIASIDRWAPFMKVLQERGIPVTLHSDLGNDANATAFLPLMKHVLEKYPDNKIVWAHMGLSKEQQHMDVAQHIHIMKEVLEKDPNLMLDISWDALYNAYHEHSAQFVAFFNEYPDRILPGTDFVAAANKNPDQYARELDVTSQFGKAMNDDAFRKIVLGDNYFRLLGLDYRAPPVCSRTGAHTTPAK